MKFQNPSIHGSKDISYMYAMHHKALQTDGQLDEHPRSNMPLQLLRSWGDNYGIYEGSNILLSAHQLIIYTIINDKLISSSSIP